MKTILITGGAGFVGSSLARKYREDFPAARIVAFDNLKRRGSELNAASFKDQGIDFVHGDIRSLSDLEDLNGTFDLFVEASAEPSVLAGLTGSPNYLVQTNLQGTLNCLEFGRKRAGGLLFLSTSRVYSIAPLREIKLEEKEKRFEISAAQTLPGVSSRGISESFPTHLARSLYGATKLASEMMIQEYADTYGMKAVISRCGVLAGPGQFGKVDQGVFTLWVANHFFGKPLKYTGFGGKGKQVRDLLHPNDLYSALRAQVDRIEQLKGQVMNLGGGREISVSLTELTDLCRAVTGRSVDIQEDPKTNPVDIPLYLSDSSKAAHLLGWKANIPVARIVEEIFQWIQRNETQLRPIFT